MGGSAFACKRSLLTRGSKIAESYGDKRIVRVYINNMFDINSRSRNGESKVD
jgi:hypothetical protein